MSCTKNFVLYLFAMKPFLFFSLILLFTALPGWGEEHSTPYTQADRDRLVRLETKVEGLDKGIDDLTLNMNSRFSQVNNKIDRLENKFDSYFMRVWSGIDVDLWTYRLCYI